MEFKTKKAWETFVDKGISEGKTPQQMNKLAGTYDGPEGRFTVHQKEGSNRGWTPANQAVRAKRGAKRTEAGIIQDQIMLDTLKKGGLSDKEARAILAREKAAYTNVKRIAKRWTQDPDIPGDYQAGHETAALKGGGNYGDNARVEIGKSRVGPDGVIRRGNQSRGMLNEFDDSIKPAMAIPREGRGGEDTALKNLLKIDENPNIMDLGLTPQDRQRMKANPSQANEIIQARQNQIAAIETRPIKPNKLLKIARHVPKIGAGLTLLGIIGDSVQAAQTAEEIQQQGLKDKHKMQIASIVTGMGSLAFPPLAIPSLMLGLGTTTEEGKEPKTAPTEPLERFIKGYESGEEVSPKDDQKLQQYRAFKAGGGYAAVSGGMTRKQVIELGQGNLRVKDRGIQQRADKSGLSFLEQELYEAGGGKKKQGDNRLSMQQVMEIGQKNLNVQEEQLRLNYAF